MEKMRDEDYFSREALSCSGIKKLLKLPASFLLEKEDTAAMVQGRAFHGFVLERDCFFDRFAVAPECDKRTTVGKNTWAEFLEESAGKQPLTKKEFEDIEKWAMALCGHRMYGTTLGKILEGCQVEVAHFWDQEFDCGVIPCKCKYDAISEKFGLAFDLKTAQDASQSAFMKAIYGDFAYYLQSAFYRLPDPVKGFGFRFLAVEKSAPFGTGVYHMDDMWLDYAFQQISKAAEIYQNGVSEGLWSSQYNDELEMLPAPKWFGRE